MEEVEQSGSEVNDGNLSKEEKVEIERNDLLNRVVSGNITTIKDRVAYILNHSQDARNSDIELVWSYWLNFEENKFNGQYITKDQLTSLTRTSSLIRMRAKIQNDYKLFQADQEVQEFRGVLEEEFKTTSITDRPIGLNSYTVYIDESGKTQDFLTVGSVWLFSSGPSFALSYQKIRNWKIENNITFEFHFKEVTSHRIGLFKNFFVMFLSTYPEAGFKLIVLNNKGITNMNSTLTDLTFHLLNKGVNHENESGRAPLPRNMDVWIDEEERGSDKLKVENLKERLTSQKINGLYVGEIQAVSSADNFFIQAIDLFLGAVNRKLHFPGGSNVKDEFADFILELLKFDVDSIDQQNQNIDNSAVFSLRD